jgi:hypothetical protein
MSGGVTRSRSALNRGTGLDLALFLGQVLDMGEIRLHPGVVPGHRDRVLIRRETERDADVIRAITTAAFASGRPPGQIRTRPG